jgi:uncharacterized membrane protein (GlpM family)
MFKVDHINLCKVLPKFKTITRIIITKRRLIDETRDKIHLVLNTICPEIKSIELNFNSTNSITIHLFCVKFLERIEQIKKTVIIHMTALIVLKF